MKTFKDQLNRTIKINFPPQRIVSLVPSQTELLVDLGLENQLVGITRFCIHPKQVFDVKTKVGGTKNYKLDKIRALKPDVIIANKEENDKESLETLAKEFPVWISDIENLEEAYEMILGIGKITATETKAKAMVLKLKTQFSSLNTVSNKKRIAYLIWKDPLMSINKNTFIHDILQRAGFENVFSEKADRYPEISMEALQKAKLDFLFLSSEPYPFKEKHIAEFKEKLPSLVGKDANQRKKLSNLAGKGANQNVNTKIKIVDGEMFSWYGSRLLKVCDYIRTQF